MIRYTFVEEGACASVAAAPVFEEQFDIVVIGLGTAGAPAAALAAEKGYRVLGLERLSCAGGTTTATGILKHYFGCPGGRAFDLEKELGAADHETRKLALEQALLSRGVCIRYESILLGLYMQDSRVVGLRARMPQGERDIACRMLLDCTGDAHAARMAGVPCSFGREVDGLAQPYTMVAAVERQGETLMVNLDAGRVDPRSDISRSQALIFSRSEERLQTRWTGRLLCHMPLIGIREGWRIQSEEDVRFTDYFADRVTAEPAFYSYSDYDKHGCDTAFDSEARADWGVGANLAAWNVSLAVPWKTVVPKHTEGMLVACRAVGVDRDSAACVRMIPDMLKLAEVAVEVADISLTHGIAAKDVPYGELSARLRKSGCLDPAHDRGVWVDGALDCDGKPLQPRRMEWLTSPEQLFPCLATDEPGLAIWSARRMGKRALPALRELVRAEQENVRKHAAFALAGLGDRTGLEVLREMVASRDAHMLRDCRKYNQHRGPMAIYHLGRLADRESVELLLPILCDPREAEREIYAVSERYPAYLGIAWIYFAFFSQALGALLRIGNAHEDLRPRISQALTQAFADEGYAKRLSPRPPLSFEGGSVRNMAAIAARAKACWDAGTPIPF